MEFTIRYTMDSENYSKVINGNSEMEARALFTKEMKQQKYVITAIESLGDQKDKEDKTTKEKMDDDEDAAEEEKDSVSKK